MTGRIPFWRSLGVGAAAREPSPRKIVVSSHLVSCAASLMVNGLTRTVTEMEEAPSEGMAVVYLVPPQCLSTKSRSERKHERKERGLSEYDENKCISNKE